MSKYIEVTKDGNNYVVNPNASGSVSKLFAYGGTLSGGYIMDSVAYHTQEFTESDIGNVVTGIFSTERLRSCSISVQQFTVGWAYREITPEGSEDPAALGWYHSIDYGQTWEPATEHVPDANTYIYGEKTVGLINTDLNVKLPRRPECDINMPSVS